MLITKREVIGDMSGEIHPVGREATFVERLGKTKLVVEIRIPDSSLVGGARYDVTTVSEEDLDWKP